MLIAVLGLIFAVLGVSCCVYLWLELQRRLTAGDIDSLLKQSSEELSKTYAKQFREIETEWIDMYQKLTRLAGRMDKNRGLEQQQTTIASEKIPSRSDLIRQHRRGGA